MSSMARSSICVSTLWRCWSAGGLDKCFDGGIKSFRSLHIDGVSGVRFPDGKMGHLFFGELAV